MTPCLQTLTNALSKIMQQPIEQTQLVLLTNQVLTVSFLLPQKVLAIIEPSHKYQAYSKLIIDF